MDTRVDPAIEALPAPLRPLARAAVLKRLRRGTVFIEEGDRGDLLYIVLRGRVKAYSVDARGREIVYGTYGPGEYLGEMSLDGGARSASVATLEETVCAVVTRQTLRTQIAADPELAFELIGRIIRRVRTLTEITRGLALLDVYGRLVRVLEALVEPTAGAERAIAPRPTHTDLAARVGASREMVSRLMKDLERGGYLRGERGRLVILRALPSNW